MSVKHAYVVGKNNALVDMPGDMFIPWGGDYVRVSSYT